MCLALVVLRSAGFRWAQIWAPHGASPEGEGDKMSRMSGLVIDHIKKMRIIASNWVFHMGEKDGKVKKKSEMSHSASQIVRHDLQSEMSGRMAAIRHSERSPVSVLA